MIKICKYKLLYLFFLFIAHNFTLQVVLADDVYLKNTNNPLTVTFQNTEYKSILQSHIYIENNEFKGVFSVLTHSGKYVLAAGNSTDGSSWNIYKTLLTHQYNLFAPRLLKENDNLYKLFFTIDHLSTFKIYYTSCTAQLDCTGNINLVIESSLNWESKGVFSGFPYKNNDSYYLFYGGWEASQFRIGLATSNDGTTWAKCLNNPILSPSFSSDGPFFYNKTLLAHTDLGITKFSLNEDLSCQSNWNGNQTILTRGPNSYDSQHMIAPSLVDINGQKYLYYSGLGPQGWTLNLAMTEAVPEQNYPIVIVPGIFASWNKNALLYLANTTYADWKLNPFTTEYQGLQDTFDSLGMVRTKDYYIFPYNWSQKLEDSAADLNEYITNEVASRHGDTPVNIVGHSLGGVVSQIYTQNNQERVNKLITIGSPHMGTAEVYKAVAGGEPEVSNTLMWLAQELVIEYFATDTQKNYEVINSILPVLRDLLPIEPYLFNDSTQIDLSSMVVTNSILPDIYTNAPGIFPKLTTINGNYGSTLAGFTIKNRTHHDKLSGKYPDGRPHNKVTANGDGFILQRSSAIHNPIHIDNADHTEIIHGKESIKKILETLEIPYTENDIKTSKKTQVTPAILFLMLSPAELSVEKDGVIYNAFDDMILIPNAANGNYTVTAQGKGQGNYTILVGMYTNNGVRWESIDGVITAQNPTSQIHTHTLTFNSTNLTDSGLNVDNPLLLFDELIEYATHIKNTGKHIHLTKAIEQLKDSKFYYKQGRLDRTQKILTQIHNNFFKEYDNIAELKDFEKLINKLEHLYTVVLTQEHNNDSISKISKKLTHEQKELENIIIKLEKNNKKNSTTEKIVLIEKINDRIQELEEFIVHENYYGSDIRIKSIQELVNIVR